MSKEWAQITASIQPYLTTGKPSEPPFSGTCLANLADNSRYKWSDLRKGNYGISVCEEGKTVWSPEVKFTMP